MLFTSALSFFSRDVSWCAPGLDAEMEQNLRHKTSPAGLLASFWRFDQSEDENLPISSSFFFFVEDALWYHCQDVMSFRSYFV